MDVAVCDKDKGRHVVKLLLSFFQVKKQTEQRYREQDNESNFFTVAISS